jgi:putative endonuclease
MAWKRSSVRIRYSPQIPLKRSGIFVVFYLYILYSKQVDRFYVGSTDDLQKRLQSHLAGISKYTAIAGDWVIVYSESFATRQEASKRELEVKKKKSRKYIEWLIEKRD